jgi:hypothetical protein
VAKPAAIDTLPEDVRLELAAGLKGSGWGDIDGWTEWLASKGFVISRAAVGRFNRRTKMRFQEAWAEAEQAAAMARVMVANKEDDGAILKANELLASDGLLRVQLALREVEALVQELQESEEEGAKADAAGLTLKLALVQGKIMKGVADLNNAGIKRAEYQAKLQAKMDETFKALESAAESGAGPRKLDADTLRIVRQEIYGLV